MRDGFLKCGEYLFQNAEKGQLFRTANLYRRGRGVMTSISEKLVSFCAKSDWKFEKCDTALLEVSMEYEKYAKALCGPPSYFPRT